MRRALLAEPADPPGQWTVVVVLTDAVRGVSVPLKAHYPLTGASVRVRPAVSGNG